MNELDRTFSGGLQNGERGADMVSHHRSTDTCVEDRRWYTAMRLTLARKVRVAVICECLTAGVTWFLDQGVYARGLSEARPR